MKVKAGGGRTRGKQLSVSQSVVHSADNEGKVRLVRPGETANTEGSGTCQDLLRDRSQRETPRLLTPAKKPGCDHLEGKTGEEQAQVLTVSELLSAFLHHEGGAGSVPGGGAKILHALLPKNQTIKQKQYWYKFNKKVKKKSPFHKQKVPSTAGLTH